MAKVMKFAGKFADTLPYSVDGAEGFVTWGSMEAHAASLVAEGFTVIRDPFTGDRFVLPPGF